MRIPQTAPPLRKDGAIVAIAVGDLYQLRVWCLNTGVYTVNTMHYEVTATSGAWDPDGAIATDWWAYIDAAWLDLMTTTSEVIAVSEQKLFPVHETAVVIAQVGVTGTVAGDTLPFQVCGRLKLLTGLAGRQYNGRLYIPFPGEGDSDAGGSPTAGYRTRLTILADLIEDPINITAGADTATITPCVFSRTHGTREALVNVSSVRQWGTQRRRSLIQNLEGPPI